MDDKTTARPADQPEPDYERLCMSLYAYRFGAISFLELIERLETGLGLSHQTKVLHFDDSLRDNEGEQRRCPNIAEGPA
jgi:hypothetical protein